MEVWNEKNGKVRFVFMEFEYVTYSGPSKNLEVL